MKTRLSPGDYADMSGVQNREVTAEDDDIRVDRWFRRHFPDLKHGRLEKLLRTGQIRVDGGRVKASTRLEAGQILRIPPLPAASAEQGGDRERGDRRPGP